MAADEQSHAGPHHAVAEREARVGKQDRIVFADLAASAEKGRPDRAQYEAQSPNRQGGDVSILRPGQKKKDARDGIREHCHREDGGQVECHAPRTGRQHRDDRLDCLSNALPG